MITSKERETIRELLCDLGSCVQQAVIKRRAEANFTDLSEVSEVTEADTIYHIDKFSEEALLEWFEQSWPDELPVQVIAEGLEEQGDVCYPKGTAIEDTRFKVLIDPIDGTRELMFDKRSAWVLAGATEQKGANTSLQDVVVASMTELPTTRQGLVDQISGVKGCGREGLVCKRTNLYSGECDDFKSQPSRAKDLDHGVAGFMKCFPEAKVVISQFEVDLWSELIEVGKQQTPLIFDDQYVCTGGQFYELMMGHYRFFGDIRPEALKAVGHEHTLCCHPYDAVTWMLLDEAGCVFESPWGGPVDPPIDTTTSVSWVAYANPALARIIRPHLQRLMRERFRESK